MRMASRLRDRYLCICQRTGKDVVVIDENSLNILRREHDANGIEEEGVKIVLGLVEMEIIFFTGAHMVMCFTSVTKTVDSTPML